MLQRLRIPISQIKWGTAPLSAFIALAAWPAAAHAVQPGQVQRAFDARLAARYPTARHEYSTCPTQQDLGGEVGCSAELYANGRWHLVNAIAVDDGQGGVRFSYMGASSWRRRFSRYSLRPVGHTFGAPGVASVNASVFDWEWLTSGAWAAIKRGHHRFSVIAYDGNSGGLQRIYRFRCRFRRRVVRCHNAFGDAIHYKPFGGPRLSLFGYGAAHWGASMPRVRRTLGASFDCSGGPISGACAPCPDSPELTGITLAFAQKRLVAAFMIDPTARTTRGIHVGSPLSKVRRAYPHGRLLRNAPLTSGLSTYYLYVAHGHALTFAINKRRVRAIDAFAHASQRSSEFCA